MNEVMERLINEASSGEEYFLANRIASFIITLTGFSAFVFEISVNLSSLIASGRTLKATFEILRSCLP